ncbi:MAG: glycosyltransferase family 4 protein [Candidatus ainarchaeum sp.]|jgi:glycosyltransferase involved in cell wall biosynthesis|nr:glycosyltransferase family 4 protein [Candidatus ainarchaeum sp.]MDD4128229.1 glycosyltransferase family 4 protein [Candidatus ainarchaeum sp.]MDD4468268.1 glycosyltransferase family 4 protein [Candidatus ainarchaeum sp.]
MKVLFIVNENPDSGIKVYADIIARELSKKGVIVNIDSKYDEKYDLIHVHSCRPENLAKMKIHQPYTPVVTSTHMTSGEVQGLVPDMVLSMLDFGLSTFYVSCEKVFVTSPHIMKELSKNNLLTKKLILLSYPLDKDRFEKVSKKEVDSFKKKMNLDNRKKTILCVASIQYRKGIFEFAEVAKKMPQYNFVWVGKIPNLPYLKNKDEINELVKNNKGTNITFTGALYKKDLACAYAMCDLFWLPSFSETFGLVIIEAASFGKPVLIRNIPVKEMFKGFVQTYSSTPDEKLIKILENEKFASKLGKAASKTLKKFSLNKHIDILVKEYKKVAKK